MSRVTRLYLLSFVTVLLAATQSFALPIPVAGPVFNPATGHYYTLLSPGSWTDSEAAAIAFLGGHLVTINDAAEQAFVQGTIGALANAQGCPSGPNICNLWTGLRSSTAPVGSAVEANYSWVSGEAKTYTNWLAGEPSGDNPGGYVTMAAGSAPAYGWNDIINTGNPNRLDRGVVETAPEPGTLLLLGPALVGAAVATWRRRRIS